MTSNFVRQDLGALPSSRQNHGEFYTCIQKTTSEVCRDRKGLSPNTLQLLIKGKNVKFSIK